MPLPKDFEATLWGAADALWANSQLKPTEYQLPVLALLFLKYADAGFAKAHAALASRRRRGAPGPEDYRAEGAVYLRPEHRWQALLQLPDGADLGRVLNDAMRAVEEDNDALKGVLPRDYARIDKGILRDLLKALNRLEEDPEGDVYGRVYEYFLGAFAPKTLQKGGEYFTPYAVVRLMVDVLEPFGGRIFDPACGSGGMFVQSARFVAEHKGKGLSVFGQEKMAQTIQLCRMNLAIHGLQGSIREVKSSLYEWPVEKEVKEGFDFVLSNPPFNLKGVDRERIKDDPYFLLYSFMAEHLHAQVMSYGSGATVQHMRVPDATRLTIRLAPLHDQKRIGAFLGAMDDLIENNLRRIRVLEEIGRQE